MQKQSVITPERKMMCWALLGLGIYVGMFKLSSVSLGQRKGSRKVEMLFETILLFFYSKACYPHWALMGSFFPAAALACSTNSKLKGLEYTFQKLSQEAWSYEKETLLRRASELHHHCEELSINEQETVLLDAIFSMGLLIGLNQTTELATSVGDQRFALMQLFEAFSEALVRRMDLPLTLNTAIFASTVFAEANRAVHLKVTDVPFADVLQALINDAGQTVLKLRKFAP